MSNVLLVQSSISGERSRSQCHLLAGSSCSRANHRSPISRTAYALASAAGVAFLVAAFAPVSHAQRAEAPFGGLAGACSGIGGPELKRGTIGRLRGPARHPLSKPAVVLAPVLRLPRSPSKLAVN